MFEVLQYTQNDYYVIMCLNNSNMSWNNGKIQAIQLEKSISEIYNVCYKQVVPQLWVLDFDSILNFQYIFFVNRIESRWLRIPFEELHPKLKGIERINAESDLREATQRSHKVCPLSLPGYIGQ